MSSVTTHSSVIKIFVSIFLLLSFIISNLATAESLAKTIEEKTPFWGPVTAAVIASQSKGLGHFAVIYGQSIATLYLLREVGERNKWEISARPYKPEFGKTYGALPSAHIMKVWTAASYTRVFSENKLLSVPLYVAAAVTAHRRVKVKAHTKLQVFTSIALSELIMEVNSRMNWSNEYRTTTFNLAPDGASISLKINF